MSIIAASPVLCSTASTPISAAGPRRFQRTLIAARVIYPFFAHSASLDPQKRKS
jgi:hypothetical protein